MLSSKRSALLLWTFVLALVATGCPDPKTARSGDSGPATADASDDSDGDLDDDGYTAATDCDDSEASTHPGADELCDGKDNDCDGEIDEEAIDATTWYLDVDGDGFGTTGTRSCSPLDEHTEVGGDCDDSDATVNPDAVEACDGWDNNCSGEADEGFGDEDGDGVADCVDRCPVHVDAATDGGDGTPDAPLASITEALTSAPADCVEVSVAPGVYHESIDFGSTAWRISSTAGADSTVVEPPSGTRGVLVVGVGSSAGPGLLEGLTIRGGYGAPIAGVTEAEVGGGVAAYDAFLDIRTCIIEGNSAHTGGGAYLRAWHGSVEDTLVLSNTATDKGGGVLLGDGSTGTIQDSEFRGNAATFGSADGGALFIGGGSSTLIQRNLFEDNFAEGSGGALRSMDGSASIINNFFFHNRVSTARYDAVYFSYDDGGLFAHNTLIGNALAFAQPTVDDGHEITTAVLNNIVWESPGAEVTASATSLPAEFRHNLVFGEDAASYEGVSDPTGLDGNSSLEPGLDVDSCPSEGSAAVDAGEDLSTLGVTDDFYGRARPSRGGSDLGACELP
ncbi:MAG: right-handed parallel beta-helix repeat-containing protein [Alphaproteobacteria bacterium]|nr:right-handed parallel beta-helix repeat-containing protein [Alphaproteobacteria bacterium]